MSDVTTLADELAAALSEPKTMLLRQVIEVIGVERTQAHFAATLAIEAAGGELTKNEKRRRTPGGVFFRLVRADCSKAEEKTLFPKPVRAARGAAAVNAPTWAAVENALNGLPKGEKGKTAVKITLIGRPLKTAQIGDSMLCQMVAAGPGDLPKGLPTPPASATAQSYAVFIALPAWRKVQAAMEHVETARAPADAVCSSFWPKPSQPRICNAPSASRQQNSQLTTGN